MQELPRAIRRVVRRLAVGAAEVPAFGHARGPAASAGHLPNRLDVPCGGSGMPDPPASTGRRGSD